MFMVTDDGQRVAPPNLDVEEQFKAASQRESGYVTGLIVESEDLNNNECL